jgi:hypothetical protein
MSVCTAATDSLTREGLERISRKTLQFLSCALALSPRVRSWAFVAGRKGTELPAGAVLAA